MAANAEGGAVVRQGHLRKLKTMKKKYFVLRAETSESSARLEYYESEKKFRSGAAPRRVLPLKSCYNITRRLDLKQKHVIALFTKEEQLCIVADNEQDLHAWLTSILKLFRSDDASQELLHPIQHVWQVNVQKKGLGATRNIQGLYNLCLTDSTITLVKIKSHNHVISDLDIPERVQYSLKNIRRCGDSECFFYMEVGRQTVTGAGELWMHSDDSNIAQSMHSTIYHAMRNCAKETENEKDHIVVPRTSLLEGSNPLPARRQTYSDGRGRAGLYNADMSYNTLTDKPDHPPRVIKHHRTVSLPTGCPLFQEPLKISHGRTWSAPLTGEELDRAILEKTAMHSSCKTVNGTGVETKKPWCRRASTGTRFTKLSPAHTKNAPSRNRCDTMPSRVSSYEPERPQATRLNERADVTESSCEEIDFVTDWCRTPRIPEEPDTDIRDFTSMRTRGGSVASVGADSTDGYMPMAAGSCGSVCSGTPSTDPRFAEYTLEPATAHIAEPRAARAYSVGSRPPGRPEPRLRAYSAGARGRPAPRPAPHARPSADDLMELDFSPSSPATKVIVARTPPTAGFAVPRRPNVDEYVDMSPRNAGYVEMMPGDLPPAALAHTPVAAPAPASVPAASTPIATPDGYVEMSYGRAATRPIAIGAPRSAPPAPQSPPQRAPLGSQTIFHMSIESPESPPERSSPLPPSPPLTTVRELQERRSPEPIAGSPQYVTLVRPPPPSVPATPTAPATPTPASPEDAKEGALHYAALDLQPQRAAAATQPHLYTQIDFVRSVCARTDAT
ncbi:insulin receptor substrate 1 isoform X2 [Aricia agestis]|uniref:insulin receptor substrate 1 isoform X2 n=1 Tax=Aricia agestis TaxID=91739 RepID=UPI001C20990F|nr:insulin receptor substrate 1 isoform X2 [Aricia agestis]